MTIKSKSTKSKPAHPSYQNPTIAEALCELHFALPDGVPWKASLAGDLFKQVQQEFPEMEPQIEVGLKFELGPQRTAQSLLPPRPRMRFKHKERPLQLQLGPNVFTVNVLPRYPGWKKMREDVLSAWQQACLVLKPSKLTRIGLRYINRIERTKENEPPAHWFKASDYLPKAVLHSQGAFLSRVESQIDSHNRVIVTFAEVQQEGEDNKKGIVFDIDRIIEKELALNQKELLAEMDRLHEHIWGIFEAVQTKRLVDHLKGGTQ
jgi:uncharacterized protein (TIGR04255 family)